MLTSPAVTLDDFWALIERSAAESTSRWNRTELLTEWLAKLPADDIIDFEVHLTAQRKRVDTWLLWGVASYLMEGFCSDDSFFYFQPWLVGLGRETFEKVAADADALADVPEIRGLAGRPLKDWADEDFPEWEGLNYVALEAYQEITGKEDGLDDALSARGLERVCDNDPQDEEWDERSAVERTARIPRLNALFS